MKSKIQGNCLKFIAHRINTISELEKVPVECGVEIDLRDFGSDIILAHDPFEHGESFENFLTHYQHDLLILNIKSERIEWRVLELVQKYGVKKYVFLDSTFPMIYAMSKTGEQNIALRYSEFEGLETLRTMMGRVKFVWVDCFNILPLDQSVFKAIVSMGYEIIIVSPELQSQPEKMEIYAKQMLSNSVYPHYICTKIYNIAKWKNYGF